MFYLPSSTWMTVFFCKKKKSYLYSRTFNLQYVDFVGELKSNIEIYHLSRAYYPISSKPYHEDDLIQQVQQ